MDTHSREADARMELLMAAAYRAGCAPDTLGKILDCLVTEEALAYIAKDGCLSATRIRSRSSTAPSLLASSPYPFA